jgi:hypothetical protein
MKNIVRVNIHPRPTSRDYDYHLPHIGNNYNQENTTSESYLSKFINHIDPSNTVYLTSCGEPVSRLIAVKKIIENHYNDIVIESPGSTYTTPDPLFNNGYTVVSRQAIDADKLAKKYLEYYPVLQKFSQRYTYEYHSRDHGYFNASNRFWYQYGRDMPEAPGVEHMHLYKIFDTVFEQLVNTLKTSMQTIGIDESMLRSKLMLRLSHNPPGVRIDNLVVNRHVDNTIVTAWVYQDHPGAYIDHGQEFEEQAVPIENIHDIDTELLLIPGLDYCDQINCATPATFHSVRELVIDHRISLVAFIKY